VSDKPYSIYTEQSAGAPVVTLAAGERILSIAVTPDGTNNVTVDIAAVNINNNAQMTALKNNPLNQDWNGALKGPGSVTFGNLNGGKYVVTTETQ
jgi:hypothetical protein